MLGKFIVFLGLCANFVQSDWVKLPEIKNTLKTNNKIQTVSSLSDFTKSSILGSSDVLNSVFSYDPQKVLSSTTETAIALVTKPTYSRHSNTKKYFQSTVTSKNIQVNSAISDRFDHDETMMEPVKLLPNESIQRIVFLNHTIPMKVHPTASSGKFLSSTQETDDDDDGVTVVGEDETLDSADEELMSSEEDYEFEYETETPEPSTTKAPIKKPALKPQRRIFQAASKKAKPQNNNLSFSSFMKFLKNIQDSFATRTAKNINDKVNMLRKFRDKLLIAINSRIKSLWKNQSQTKITQRTKRTAGGTGSEGWMSQHGGAMESYPSAEGALLSISFLTFAVFLIKLVLVSKFYSRIQVEIGEKNVS